MRYWETMMQVVDQKTKEIRWVCGRTVKAPTRERAQAVLDKHDFFYLVLGDQIVAEIPCKPGTTDPDWERMIDYDEIEGN